MTILNCDFQQFFSKKLCQNSVKTQQILKIKTQNQFQSIKKGVFLLQRSLFIQVKRIKNTTVIYFTYQRKAVEK